MGSKLNEKSLTSIQADRFAHPYGFTYSHAAGPYMPYFLRKSDQKENTCVCASSVFISPVLPYRKTGSDDYKGSGFVCVCVKVCVLCHLTGPRSGLSFLDVNRHPQHLLSYFEIMTKLFCV